MTRNASSESVDTAEAAPRSSSGDLLALYVQDHRAGAAAGLELVRRARRHAGSGELAATLAWLEGEVDEDRRSLDAIMERLGVEPSRWKMALGMVGERAGRLKLNGRLFTRSPLSTLLELEAITAAVYAKRNLWQSLASARPDGLDAVELATLADRATTQLERLQVHHPDAARNALGPARSA